MHNRSRFANVLWDASLRPGHTALVILLMLLFLIFLLMFLTFTAQPAQGQTFQVLHNFTGGPDGGYPPAGLAMDAAGNLYGVTYSRGDAFSLCDNPPGCGTVFKLTHFSFGWVTAPIYEFQGRSDGAHPGGGVAIAADGSLYGTTSAGYGTLFRLTPPPTAPASAYSPWSIAVLHTFDGDGPEGDLVFDAFGALYGTTIFGGAHGVGSIYKWAGSLTVIYSPQYSQDGRNPEGGVAVDQSENLYGIFSSGGQYQDGAVYELSPYQQGWREQILYDFYNEGYVPVSGLVIDSQGNLYGRKGGLIFKLTQYVNYWDITEIYDTGSDQPRRLVMDSAGNLYGTAYANGAYGMGSVLKLTPSIDGWTYTSLHDFCPSAPGCSDGAQPVSNVVFDTNGNLYGTASAGGANGYGVVWEITP